MLILEFTGKIQELQKEIYCMNDSRDFQDAESVRSGHTHVTSQLVSFKPYPMPEGMLCRSTGMPSRREGPPKHLGHAWYIGKRFCRSSCVFYSTLSAGFESMEFRNIRTDSPTTRRKNENQTPVQDQRCSQDRQPKIQSSLVREDSSKNCGRPTTTADFRSSF